MTDLHDGDKVAKDGTILKYCHPHRRYEWDCEHEFAGGMHCGGVNSSRAMYCGNCGTPRTSKVVS